MSVAALLSFALAALLAPAPARAENELDYGLAEVRLDRVEVRGNEVFSTGQLKDLLQFREATWLQPLSKALYRPHLIETRLKLVEKFYRRNGFHEVAVQLDSIGRGRENGGDILYISVVEGRRTYLRRVSFSGVHPFTEEELRRRLRLVEGEPAPMDLNDVGSEVYALRSFCWDRAYLAADIRPHLSMVAAGDSLVGAFLEYTVDAGTRFTVRHIDVVGARATRPSLIDRDLRIAEGDEFSWLSIEESRRNLLDSALFRDVGFEPVNLDTAAGLADLRIRVAERKPGFYELGAGIGSRQLVRLIGAWGYNNLWGSGRRLTLRGRIHLNKEEILGSEDETNLELNFRTDVLYVSPYVFGTTRPLDVNLFAERVTRGESAMLLETLGLSFGTRWRPHRWLDHRLLFQVEQNDPQLHSAVRDSTLEYRFENDIHSSQTRSLIYSINADLRDNLFRPSNGRLYTGRVQLAGGLIEGDNSFVSCQLGWHGYTGTPLGGVLAFRASIGGVWPFGASADLGADGVPYSDRFFAGGVSSVRGYLENSLGPQITDEDEAWAQQVMADAPIYAEPARGGNYRLLTNVEWRFRVVRLGSLDLASVLFIDGGNVWERVEDIQLSGFRLLSWPREPGVDGATKISDYRYSVGTGVRLDTPFGPFRLDVGFPLKRALYVSEDGQTRTEDDKVMWHFSLGYPF